MLERRELAGVVNALMFAAAGVVVALLIASWTSPVSERIAPVANDLLPSTWTQIRSEPREKIFLALAAVLGTLAALIGARTRPLGDAVGWPVVAFLVALVPSVNALCGLALSDAYVPSLLAAGAAGLGLLGALVVWRASVDRTLAPKSGFAEEHGVASPRGRSARPVVAHVAVITVLGALLAPVSFEAVAAVFGYEMHVISFIIGPALYRFGPGLVPGIDYFSQYSVGLPYLFSFFLGATADQTMIRYAALMVGSMFAFYLAAFYLLWWLFRSWCWALGVTLATLLLQFHTDRPFFDPSSYVLRYPLLVATVAAFAWWVAGRFCRRRALPLALSLAMSLFLNTETGLYQLLAVTALSFIATPGWRGAAARAAGIALLSVMLFIGASALAFGSRVFSVDFFRYLAEPFFIYGGGLGGWPVDWGYGWQLLYNVIAPGIALGTLGWGCVALKTRERPDLQPRLAAVTLFSCLAIMLSAKYWNMSIVGLWHVNAFPFFVVIAWWARELIVQCGGQSVAAHRWMPFLEPRMVPVFVKASMTAALVAVTGLLLLYADDKRNPSLYAIRAYLKYPSILNYAFTSARPACVKMDCAAPRIAAEDVRLIARLTGPKDRVAILHWYDWAYLIEARRSSKFHFLPSPATFTRRQAKESLQGIDLIFLRKRSDGKPEISHPDLQAELSSKLEREFRIVAEGRELIALARKR